MKTTYTREKLPQSAFEEMIAKATLLEKDAFGPKVYNLVGDRILKLFRSKRLLSSNLFDPYAKRFARHSVRLKQCGIRTIQVQQWGKIPHLKRHYVLYEKLAGSSLRESLDWKPNQLGGFFAALHHQGVYFRSCHLGNILWTPEQDFALIDIADLHLRSRPLSEQERRRNFQHLIRVRKDRQQLAEHREAFVTGYQNESPEPMSEAFKAHLLSQLTS